MSDMTNGWLGTCSDCGHECMSGAGSWWHTGEPCKTWRSSQFIARDRYRTALGFARDFKPISYSSENAALRRYCEEVRARATDALNGRSDA